MYVLVFMPGWLAPSGVKISVSLSSCNGDYNTYAAHTLDLGMCMKAYMWGKINQHNKLIDKLIDLIG